MLERIAVDYRKKSKLGFEVYPSPTISTCVVEPQTWLLARDNQVEPNKYEYQVRPTKSCAVGYFGDRKGDIPGWTYVEGAGAGEWIANCGECADLCSVRDKCLSYQCSPSELKCNLNSVTDPTRPKVRDYMFCSKKLCANGYNYQAGDVPGWTSVDGAGGGQSVDDCAKCADLCSVRNKCLSYQCSPSELKCNLNSVADPTRPK